MLQSSGLALGVVGVTVISMAMYIEKLFEKKGNKVEIDNSIEIEIVEA